MPGMSGSQLTREIERRSPDVKVLFVSGYAAPDEAGTPLVPYLQKPYTTVELIEALDAPVRRRPGCAPLRHRKRRRRDNQALAIDLDQSSEAPSPLRATATLRPGSRNVPSSNIRCSSSSNSLTDSFL